MHRVLTPEDANLSSWLCYAKALLSGTTCIVDMCRDYQVGFHTHSNESRFDVEQTLERYQIRPIQALEKIGLLMYQKPYWHTVFGPTIAK
ncbi:MAG: cytosine/adenosine deaminase-related metal-dependent hydrolase [Flavobacteriales bacterium]|jgi:cytosine/adenosine deaminase-related metal-dependent hydrolase